MLLNPCAFNVFLYYLMIVWSQVIRKKNYKAWKFCRKSEIWKNKEFAEKYPMLWKNVLFYFIDF